MGLFNQFPASTIPSSRRHLATMPPPPITPRQCGGALSLLRLQLVLFTPLFTLSHSLSLFPAPPHTCAHSFSSCACAPPSKHPSSSCRQTQHQVVVVTDITLSFDVSQNVDDNFQRRFIMALPLGSELAVVTFEYEAR